MALGVPFYGRSESHKAKPYRELIHGQIIDPADDVVDDHAFNGAKTIQSKTRYALDNGLAGVMIWELGQDATEDRSLLQAVGEAIDDVR